METATDFLLKHATGDLVSWNHQIEAAGLFEMSIARVEEVILDNGLLPARYQRNRQSISQEDQKILFRSQVAVIGCGGLGCYVIEELARLGVGRIVAVDPDRFEEHNLNRQLFSAPRQLGEVKVAAAQNRVAEINPAVTLVACQSSFSCDNGNQLLGGSRVAVDALDNIRARLELAESCAGLGIPLVHGAIAGWFGQVSTIFPGDTTLQDIYGSVESNKGVELSLGNPSFTPAVVAALEAAEVCKLLLGKGRPLRGRQLMIDLLSMEMNVIQI